MKIDPYLRFACLSTDLHENLELDSSYTEFQE